MSSISAHSKKVLNNLLENLAESNQQLQNLLHDFITQVTTTTKEWMDDPSDKKMTFKEAVAMVSAANVTLAEHIDMLSVKDKKQNPLLTTAQLTADETKPLKQAQTGQDSSVEFQVNKEEGKLKVRLDELEAKFSSLPNTKELMEEEILKLEQWKDKLEYEIDLKIKKSSKKQKQNFKNLESQLTEHDNRMKELCEDIQCLKEKASSSKKQLDKIQIDLQGNEKIFLKIDASLKDNADQVENIVKEVKLHSELIARLQESEKANAVLSIEALENINTKYGVMCKLLQQRLAFEKLMQIFNKNKLKSEKNALKQGSNAEVLTKIDFYEYCQRKGLKMGFVASGGARQIRVGNHSAVIFLNVQCDIETLFDTATGRFIVPVDGMYTVSLSVSCDNFVSSNVYRRSQGMTTPQSFCIGEYVGTKTCVVWLKSGDELWAFVSSKNYFNCNFSCFLIGF